MIDSDYGEYYAFCDGCGETLEGGAFNSFQDTLDELKASGWKTVKRDGEWAHYCPECAAKLLRPGASEFTGI